MTWLLDALKEYAGHGKRTAGLAGEHGSRNAEVRIHSFILRISINNFNQLLDF